MSFSDAVEYARKLGWNVSKDDVEQGAHALGTIKSCQNIITAYFQFKSIRDPLYGVHRLVRVGDENNPSTPVFRRMHGIKQLSHAYLVYPTAIHHQI